MSDHDPLTVACEDCLAPAGTPCHTGYEDTAHVTRLAAARLFAVEHGTCALCSQPIVRATDPDETWHPDHMIQTPCPPEPSQQPWDFAGWAQFATMGYTHGHPGAQHFMPAVLATTCPECVNGKHMNCTIEVLTDDDTFQPCTCTDPAHTP